MGRYLDIAARVIAELDATSQYEKNEINEKSPAIRLGERVVLLRVPRGVPSAWGEGVLALLTSPAPISFTDERWKTLQDDAFGFLQDWAAEAFRLGWTELDLFGVHRHKPLARLDSMGLVPALDGAQVVALTQDLATTVTPRGTRQTIGRPTNTSAAEVSLVWDLVSATFEDQGGAA